MPNELKTESITIRMTSELKDFIQSFANENNEITLSEATTQLIQYGELHCSCCLEE